MSYWEPQSELRLNNIAEPINGETKAINDAGRPARPEVIIHHSRGSDTLQALLKQRKYADAGESLDELVGRRRVRGCSRA